MISSELYKRTLSSLILLPIVIFFIIKGSIYFYFLFIITFLICCYEWHNMSKKKSYYILGFIFLVISFFCIFKLRINPEDNFLRFLIVTIICILTDIGGYVFGKFFRGPKLTKYSPNKTYSGAIGGYFFALLSIPFFQIYNFTDKMNLLNLIIFVILLSTISQCGDILISYFKRISNIKDTGRIIPGHGGLLDRIDGMIFAYPFSYLIMFNNSYNI